MKNLVRKATMTAFLTLAMFAQTAVSQQAEPTSASSSSTATKEHMQKHADVVEERISDLREKLKITNEQSKQWDAFAQIMRENATRADQAFHDRAQKLSTMNAVEAMKSYADLSQLHAENMQKLSSAMNDLYAVLSVDQKKVADTMYRNEHEEHHHAQTKQKASASTKTSSNEATGH
jgi:protein CpxP